MTVEERLEAFSRHEITLAAYMAKWDLWGDIAVILSRLQEQEIVQDR